MKTIGIIGAMECEIESLKTKMTEVQVKPVKSSTFHVGKIHGVNVVLAQCKVGKVHAAMCAQTMLDFFELDALINVGVAGGLSHDRKVGDLVISDKLAYHDMDVTAFGYEPGRTPGTESLYFEADSNLIEMAKSVAGKIYVGAVVVGTIASGDQFICSADVKRRIHETFGAECVEMEGAAIAHTAVSNKKPFVVIRSISDNADGEADFSFDQFAVEAAEKSAAVVDEMIKMMA